MESEEAVVKLKKIYRDYSWHLVKKEDKSSLLSTKRDIVKHVRELLTDSDESTQSRLHNVAEYLGGVSPFNRYLYQQKMKTPSEILEESRNRGCCRFFKPCAPVTGLTVVRQTVAILDEFRNASKDIYKIDMQALLLDSTTSERLQR